MTKAKYILMGMFLFTFLTNSSLYAAGGTMSGYVYEDKDHNQIKDVGENGTLQANIIKLCKGATLRDTYAIPALNPTGYYEFNVTDNGIFTIIEDDTNTSSCTVSNNPSGWSSTSSNYITVTMTGSDKGSLNFGNFKDDILPLTAADREKAYLFQNQPSDVYRLDLVTGKMTKVANNINPSGFHINALGYNIKDGYFWGSAPRRGQFSADGYISRVGKDGSGNWVSTHYGPIPNLNIFSYSGDIDKDGKLHIYRHNSGFISIIDLDPNSPSYLTTIDHKMLINKSTGFGINIKTTDWAFNPKDDMLYTVNNGTGKHYLYRINPKTAVVENLGDAKISNSLSGGSSMGTTGNLPAGHPPLSGLGRVFGGSFFTKDGYYYLYDNGYGRNIGEVFRIDVTNPSGIIDPTAVPFSKPRYTSLNDGVMFANNEIFLDFGDAPDDSNNTTGDGTATGNYKTMLADDGARHKIDSNGSTIYLGTIPPDHEDDGQPTVPADGDGAEDDGVTLKGVTLQGSSIVAGSKINLKIKTTGIGVLSAWIDWNDDGNFTNDSERIAFNVNGASGNIVIPNISVPSTITANKTYARFRYSSDTDLNATGPASNGEVEDYLIKFSSGNQFGVWDSDEGLANQVIKTKIVNQDINLTIASLDGNQTSFTSNVYDIVKAAIYSNTQQLSSWKDVNLTDTNTTKIEFGAINQAHKSAYVTIRYGDVNSTEDVNLSEKFAIRPDKFIINPISISLKAGEGFDLNITAVDKNGTLAYDYNETNATFSITAQEQDANCSTGSISASSTIFRDGSLNTTATYSEVGRVILKIEDTGFAAVDVGDSNSTQRLIKSGISNMLAFNASAFTLDWNITNSANNMTYFSSDPANMGASLKLKLTAENALNQKLANYTDECYAKDINTTITFDINGTTNQSFTPVWEVDNNGTIDSNGTNIINNTGFSSNNNITVTTKKAQFENAKKGIATTKIDINLNRNARVAREPLTMRITDVLSSDSFALGNKLIATAGNDTANFYYGRVHAPNYEVIGMNFNATIYYEVYCRDCIQANFAQINNARESIDSVFWYILGAVDYNALAGNINKADISSSTESTSSHYYTSIPPQPPEKDVIVVQAPKLPFSDRINFGADNWLLYNRFRNITQDSFRVKFISPNFRWSGKGNEGLTLDTNISRSKLQKMDW